MNDLKKQEVRDRFFSVSVDSETNPAEVLKALTAALEKGKKTHKRVRIEADYYEGDQGFSLPHSAISLYGYRLENDEEWHKRLAEYRRKIKADLDEAQRTIKHGPNYLKQITEIDEALELSSLRCVDCLKPELGQTNAWFLGAKTLRICHECCEKRRKKAEAEQKAKETERKQWLNE